MISQDGILIVSQEHDTIRAITEAIAGDEDYAIPEVCCDLGEMVTELERGASRAALIDIDPAPDQILADLDSIICRFDSTRFIVVASEIRKEWLLRAMQSGARHFITKSEIGFDLMSVISRLVPSRPTRNGSLGRVVTVLSAGGGSGATTLAVNLASELQAISSSPVLLIDLDRWYGTAAGRLGIDNATYGVADVLAAGDRLDCQLLRSSTVTSEDGLALLASPATVNPADPAEIDFGALELAVEMARDVYEHVVIDAPRLPLAAVESLARASAVTYIVFEMNVQDIRVARAMYKGLISRGIPSEHIVPLVNRYRTKRRVITLAEVRKALGAPRIMHLTNDYQNVLQSINFGRPLRETAARSEIRREIQKIATDIHERTGATKALTR